MDGLDLASKTKQGVDELLRRSKRNSFTRILAFTFIVSLIPAAYLTYLTYVNYVFEKQSKTNQYINKQSTSILHLSFTIEQLELCIKSKSEKNVNTDWYCKEAIESYKRRSERWSATRRNRLLSEGAVELMLIDSRYYKEVHKSNLVKAESNRPMVPVITKVLFSHQTLYGIFFLMALVGLYVYYRFYWRSAGAIGFQQHEDLHSSLGFSRKLVEKPSPYLSHQSRLADVISAIQAMGTYRFSGRNVKAWASLLGEKPKSAASWRVIFDEHPEFFGLGLEKKRFYSLVLRRAQPKVYNTRTGKVYTLSEVKLMDATNKQHLSRLPLSTEQILALIEVAVKLQTQSVVRRKELRWWLPLVASLIGVVVGVVGNRLL